MNSEFSTHDDVIENGTYYSKLDEEFRDIYANFRFYSYKYVLWN